jgi:hypothetical protein
LDDDEADRARSRVVRAGFAAEAPAGSPTHLRAGLRFRFVVALPGADEVDRARRKGEGPGLITRAFVARARR